jgi:AraC-like DNA-binding protein
VPRNLSSSDQLTSRWPLPATGVRFLTPQPLVEQLATHALSRDLYPLAFGYYPQAFGHRMQRRTHETHLLLYCSGGRGELELDSGHYAIAAGDVLLLPAGLAHAYHSDRDQPWTVFWVHYDGSASDDHNRHLNACPVRGVGVQPALIAEFEQLLAIAWTGFSLPRLLHAAGRLKALLTAIALHSDDTRMRGRTPLDLDALLRLMQARLDRELDLEQLAASANLSKFHFARRFRTLTGQSPIHYFIQLKMQRACQLLDTTALSVKQVAAELGYDDPLYFSRQFRRIIGRSPSDYRAQRSI